LGSGIGTEVLEDVGVELGLAVRFLAELGAGKTTAGLTGRIKLSQLETFLLVGRFGALGHNPQNCVPYLLR
jgi:hypothetical protein